MYNIYRRTWRNKSGKLVRSKFYGIRYRFEGDPAWRSKQTRISDEQSAESYAKAWHLKKEREMQGLAIPEAELKAATAAVLPEVDLFWADLMANRRSKEHVSNVKAHLKLLAEQCGWRRIQDIQPASFIAWKSKQGHRAPKTINEFLGSARVFCNWLVDAGKLASNPLEKIKRAETRGKETRKRRALSVEEMRCLCAAAGKRSFVYGFAFYTGIRRKELSKLLVTDLTNHAGKWSVTVQASISKNHKAEPLPIHHALVPSLERHLAERNGQKRLFTCIPRCDTLRKDLERAGIRYKDDDGRQADLHALRHGTSTHMGANGAAPRAQMGMMRHHSMNLTMTTYTDEALISLREAIEKVPDILNPTPLTHPLTHGLVVSSSSVSSDVATNESEDESQSFFTEGLRREKALTVAIRRNGRKAAALGLEATRKN
jgi:site-specific recombinase XerC